MTPEEIKKIAEEYAKMHVGRADCLSDEEFNLVMSRWIADVSKAYEFLTARFYLVEKGKVEDAWQEAVDYHENIGSKCLLETLFGPDIRKEEEE